MITPAQAFAPNPIRRLTASLFPAAQANLNQVRAYLSARRGTEATEDDAVEYALRLAVVGISTWTTAEEVPAAPTKGGA